MRDLGVLKDRIEFAERHLKAAKTARERESDALLAMWTQIRDRFDAQEREIAQYRSQLSEMTRLNDELSALIDRLIASIEGNVHDGEREAIPEVARAAQELLKSDPERLAPKPAETATAPAPQPPRQSPPRQAAPPEPEPAPVEEKAPEPAPQPNMTVQTASPGPAADTQTAQELAAVMAELDALDELAAKASQNAGTPAEAEEPLELGSPIDETQSEEPLHEEHPADTNFRNLLTDAITQDDETGIDDDDDFDIDMPEPVHEDSASSGIRNLISRIEGSVSRPVGGEPAAEDDDELTRELQEIEKLRNELSGLRDKISAGR
jgi:hypothetical protein